MSKREIEFLMNVVPTQGHVLEVGTASGVTISRIAERFPDTRFLSVDKYPDVASSDEVRRACDNDAKQCFSNWMQNRMPNNFLFCGPLKSLHWFCSNRFDMAIVDGSHLYEDVLEDLLFVFTMMRFDGPILCHDYNDPHWYQVTEAVNKFCAHSPYKVTCTVGAIAVLEV